MGASCSNVLNAQLKDVSNLRPARSSYWTVRGLSLPMNGCAPSLYRLIVAPTSASSPGGRAVMRFAGTRQHPSLRGSEPNVQGREASRTPGRFPSPGPQNERVSRRAASLDAHSDTSSTTSTASRSTSTSA